MQRASRHQVRPIGQPLPDRREGAIEQIRHGQHGGAGVEPEPVAFEQPAPSTGPGRALQDSDFASGPRQVQRGSEPRQAGADDHDPVRATANPAHAQLCPAGQAPARAVRSSRVLTKAEGSDAGAAGAADADIGRARLAIVPPGPGYERPGPP